MIIMFYYGDEEKRIVYSLTGRGLFSELSNLALALVYADYNQEELTVNTRNWNARVEKGWSDYFESVLPNCNGVMCSQYIVYKRGNLGGEISIIIRPLFSGIIFSI